MSPKSVSQGDTSELSQSQSKPKEILYNGYFYDVTDFIRRHPGGNVITFYTEPGEDATQAIEQFHYRSKDRIQNILKTFKKRPALPEDRALGEKALTRHEALSADFKKLFEELIADGFFKPSIPHVIIRLIEPVALSIFTWSIFLQCETFFAKLLSGMLVGFAYSRFVWLFHEGGHTSLTGVPKIDKFIEVFATAVPFGWSAGWWNSQHNRHHAMPQRLNHDVDLATLPYVAFNARAVEDRSKLYKFAVKYQAYFYWTLDLAVVSFAWRCILHPRFQLRRKAYLEMALSIPSMLFAFHVGVFWYVWIMYFAAVILAMNFSLNHSHLDVADKPTHWIEYSLTHTANIQPSRLCDYWMGYLNYQIEHHLFPTMPQYKNKYACHRVKALADKHGLPYRVYSYWDAVKLTMKNLDTVGHELTENKIL